MTARVLLALTLVLPGLAAALDAAPVIRELQMNGRKVTQVWLGSVVTILGEGFPADALDGSHPESLKVMLGGSDVMLLVAQAESVTVLIPQFGTPTGRLPLRVTVAGRGAAEVEVDVVERLKGWIQDPEGPRRQLDPAAEDLLLAAFRFTRFELVRDETGVRFEAEGTTPDVIPENFRVDLTLNLGDHRELQSQKVQVKGHAWRATFGPYEGELPAGSYSLNLLFELSKQRRLLARRFRDSLEPSVQPIFDRVFRREFLVVGTAEEVTAQRTRLRNHLLELDTALEGLVRGLDAAAGAVPFNPAPYERWVKQGFFPLLATELDGARRERARFAFPLEPRADAWSDLALERVDDLLRARSRDLYAAANLALPDLLATPADLPPTKELRAELEAARLGALRAAGLERP